MGLRDELQCVNEEAFDRFHERPFDTDMTASLVRDNEGYRSLYGVAQHILGSLGEGRDPEYRSGAVFALGAMLGTLIEAAELQAIEEAT